LACGSKEMDVSLVLAALPPEPKKKKAISLLPQANRA
jgi:hypothetical protein